LTQVNTNALAKWIEASYNPIINASGKTYKVVKYATDITNKQLQAAEQKSLVNAISRAQAVIHFKTDGTILDANDNFCNTVGYDISEIKGKHHSMFAEPSVAGTQEYKDFWEKLANGNFDAGQYKRIGKGLL